MLTSSVSHSEIEFLSSGQRIERRGRRQGRRRAARPRARRPGGPGRAAGGDRPAPGHGPPAGRRPRAARPRAARRATAASASASALVGLGQAAADGFPLAELARPALTALRDETGESVQLFVREDDGRRCVVSLQSSHGLRWIVPEGALLPLHVGSAGPGAVR